MADNKIERLSDYLTKIIDESQVFFCSLINPQEDILITVTEMDRSIKRPSHALREAKLNPHGKATLFTEVVWLNQNWVLVIYSLTEIKERHIKDFKADIGEILAERYWFDAIKPFNPFGNK
jgi:hypothetical protein